MAGRTPRRIVALAAVAIILGGCATDEAVRTKDPGTSQTKNATKQSATDRGYWDFENDQPGNVPEGWRLAETSPTTTQATWRVTRDDTAPSGPHVLALVSSTNTGGTYNLAIAERSSFENLDLAVQAKAVAGTEDQGGGPIWRCRDANNYYICRFNPLEGNFRVYVVKDGRRRQLDSVNVQLTAGRWYEIGVLMIGNRITCRLDGSELLHATDETFKRSGMVGVWTKADAVTSFDDLAVRATRDEK